MPPEPCSSTQSHHTEMDFSTDVFLKELLSKFEWDHQYGVVSSDELLPFCDCPKFSLIANLSRRTSEGTHFVSFILRDNILMYLDPLNIYVELNSDINDFISSLEKKGVKTLRLTRAIQSIYSNYCGFFSLYFCLLFNDSLRNKGIKYEKFRNDATLKNDCIVLHNIAMAINEI